jgi:hypothetical protein
MAAHVMLGVTGGRPAPGTPRGLAPGLAGAAARARGRYPARPPRLGHPGRVLLDVGPVERAGARAGYVTGWGQQGELAELCGTGRTSVVMGARVRPGPGMNEPPALEGHAPARPGPDTWFPGDCGPVQQRGLASSRAM